MSDPSVYGFGRLTMTCDPKDCQYHVISYGSRSTTPAQRNWTPADLELGALCMALKEYEHLFLQKQITVLTDNSSVLHFKKMIPTSARQKRMLTYLMQFRLKLKFIAGVRNQAADAFSRIHQDIVNAETVDMEPVLEDDRRDFIVTVTPTEKVKQHYNNKYRKKIQLTANF